MIAIRGSDNFPTGSANPFFARIRNSRKLRRVGRKCGEWLRCFREVKAQTAYLGKLLAVNMCGQHLINEQGATFNLLGKNQKRCKVLWGALDADEYVYHCSLTRAITY